MPKTTELLYLPPDQLANHPDNPRRFYRADDLQALASSIRESGGVDQALIVVPDGHLPDGREHFLVKGHGYQLHWSPAGDAFLVRARAQRIPWAAIAKMMKQPEKRLAYRLQCLQRKAGVL